jgi:hypothetical protein
MLLFVLLAKFQVQWRHILPGLVSRELQDPVSGLLTAETNIIAGSHQNADTPKA